jgi:hypothetical protein
MSELNLNHKIIELRKLVAVMKKEGKGHQFNYVKEDQILGAISDKMDDLNLLLIPSIIPNSRHHETFEFTEKTKNGEKERHYNIVSADMNFTWIDADSKEELIVPFTMYGQMEGASQSLGSALTYANRYFLLKFFQVETTDQDPDSIRRKQKQEENEGYEVWGKIIMSNDNAIRTVKTSIKELCQKCAVRLEDMQTAFKKRNWHSYNDANLDSLFGLERFLKTVNNTNHEWHNLYGTNSRITNPTPKGQEIVYKTSQHTFGEYAMFYAKDRNEQLEIQEFYSTANIHIALKDE